VAPLSGRGATGAAARELVAPGCGGGGDKGGADRPGQAGPRRALAAPLS